MLIRKLLNLDIIEEKLIIENNDINLKLCHYVMMDIIEDDTFDKG